MKRNNASVNILTEIMKQVTWKPQANCWKAFRGLSWGLFERRCYTEVDRAKTRKIRML
jgi:hypothetical protein